MEQLSSLLRRKYVSKGIIRNSRRSWISVQIGDIFCTVPNFLFSTIHTISWHHCHIQWRYESKFVLIRNLKETFHFQCEFCPALLIHMEDFQVGKWKIILGLFIIPWCASEMIQSVRQICSIKSAISWHFRLFSSVINIFISNTFKRFHK